MSKLYIVPTPIGNLEDITLRAINILKKVDLILCEDTRVSSKLLNHFEIKNKLKAHHKFNEHKDSSNIIEKLKTGLSIALISDAGTPGISDPGYFLVRECISNNIEVETLPGATALIPAVVNSGLPCDRFVFEGFLPPKKGRNKRLSELAQESRTIIFYESPYRLLKSLEQFKEFFGEERIISVSRELSKIYEENIRGNADELLKYFGEKQIKGEIVIVVEGISKKKNKND